MPKPQIPAGGVRARAYTIPTDRLEADGTLAWDKTLVVVHVSSGKIEGVGYTYADASLVPLINGMLADHICGQDAMGMPGIYQGLRGAVRNPGQSGLAACAISAIDLALWDLKSRFLELNEAGCAAVKMKIGSNPEQDPKRAGASRRLEI